MNPEGKNRLAVLLSSRSIRERETIHREIGNFAVKKFVYAEFTNASMKCRRRNSSAIQTRNTSFER